MIQGYAPLHIAADRGHTKVVELLLSKGADKLIKVCPKFEINTRMSRAEDGNRTQTTLRHWS